MNLSKKVIINLQTKKIQLQSKIPSSFVKAIQSRTKPIPKLIEKHSYEEAFLKLKQGMLNFQIGFINNLYVGLLYQEQIDVLNAQFREIFSIEQYCQIFPQELQNFMKLFVENSLMFKRLIEEIYVVEFGESQGNGHFLNSYLSVVKKIAKKHINSNPYFTLSNQFEIEQDSQIKNVLSCYQNKQKIHISTYLIRYLAFMESKDIIKVTDEFNTEADEPIYSNQLLPKFIIQRLVQVPIQSIQQFYEEKPKVEVEYVYKEKGFMTSQQLSSENSINKMETNTVLHINEQPSGRILQELPIGQNIQTFKYPSDPYKQQKQFKYFVRRKGQDLLGLLNEQKELLRQENNRKNQIFNRKPQPNMLDFKSVGMPEVKKETIQSELLFSFNQQMEQNGKKEEMIRRKYESEIGVGEKKGQRRRSIFEKSSKVGVKK